MKWDFFKKIFPTRPYLGVDIGTTSIKVVEFDEKDERPVLRNYGILESVGHLQRLNSAIQTSGLKIIEKEAAVLLKKLLDEMKVKTKEAAATLPSFTAFTTLFDVPVMSREELAEAMKYQARSLVPLPMADVTIEWATVGEYEDEKGIKKQQIFLTSVPNEHIKRYQTLFRLAGLNLKILEIEALSLARALTLGDSGTSLIIDIGSRSTAIAVAQNGVLRYSAQTDFASSSLTQMVANGLGINVLRAELLKKQRGLTGSGGEYGLSTLIFPYLDVILNEARRIKDIFEGNYRGKIDKVVLSGGGSHLIGIEKYAADWFALPVTKANPFSRIILPSEISPLAPEIGPQLVAAIGVGMQQFIV